MKQVLLVILLCFSTICCSYAHDTGSEYAIDLINKAFYQYQKGIDTSGSYYISVINETNDLFIKQSDEAIPDSIKIKSSILTLYAYTLLDKEFGLLKTPVEKRRFFNLLVSDILALNKTERYKAYAFHALAFYYSQKEVYRDSADKYFSAAYTIMPQWPLLLHNLSWHLMEHNLTDSAMAIIHSCLQFDSSYSMPYVTWGHILSSKRQMADAYDIFRHALELNPRNKLAYLGVGFWYATFTFKDSADYYFENAYRVAPYYTRSLLNKADNLSMTGQPDKAIAIYKKILQDNSFYPDIWKYCGDAYLEKNNNRDSALYFYSMATMLDSSFIASVAYYYSKTGNKEKALECYSLKLRHNPVVADYCNLSSAYLQQNSLPGYIDSASHYCSFALALDNDNFLANQLLALVHNRKHNDDSAVHYFKRCYDILPLKRIGIRMGYYFEEIAHEAINQNRFDDAYKHYFEGAKTGNDFCKYMALGLKYEFGIEAATNAALAKEYYTKATEWHPTWKTSWQSILRLYDNGKIPMDTTDYNVWKINADSNHKLPVLVPCLEKRTGKEKLTTIYITERYPDNIHPLLSEQERLEAEEDVYIPSDIYEQFGKLYIIALKNNESFTRICNSITSSVK